MEKIIARIVDVDFNQQQTGESKRDFFPTASEPKNILNARKKTNKLTDQKNDEALKSQKIHKLELLSVLQLCKVT